VSLDRPVSGVAIVVANRFGASWAGYYLSRGFGVVATDPAPNAGSDPRKYIDGVWTTITEIGLSPGASRARLTFTPSLARAVGGVDFVQENGRERSDFQAKLFAEMGDMLLPIRSLPPVHPVWHLMDPLVSLKKALGTPNVTAELKKTIADAAPQEAGKRSVEKLAEKENEALVDSLRVAQTLK
jgi:hypothetical protein